MKKINSKSIVDLFDSNCGLTNLRLSILETKMPKELRFFRGMANKLDRLNEILDSYGERSMDIGILIGIVIGQMYNLPNKKSKKAIEDMKKLIVPHLPKEVEFLKCNR